MFSFFRKKDKPHQPAHDFSSLINRRAEDFAEFYQERFGSRMNFAFDSLHLIDTILQEARSSEPSGERKTWLCTHAGSYIFRTASLQLPQFQYQYLWYHPLDQPVMVTGLPEFRVSLLAQQAVQHRLEKSREIPVQQLMEQFEQARRQARPGDDLIFL